MKKLILGTASLLAAMAGPAWAQDQASSKADYDCANFGECGGQAAPAEAGSDQRAAGEARGMNIAGRFGKKVTEAPVQTRPSTAKAALSKPRAETTAPSRARARVTAPAPRPVVATAAATRLRLAQGITFATGSANLTASARANVDGLAESLLRPEKLATRFRIEGHTDAVGDATANKALSERRAAAVLYYLVTKGVSASRLELVGLGETALLEGIAPNSSANRRVVAKLIE